MKYTVQRANEFVSEYAKSVIDTYRPTYHAVPPCGWINDPNGFCYYNGEYHLFCQFNPYSAEWDSMHWGHWTSKDLIYWTWRGVSLAPDQPYDHFGCFSGHAIVGSGTLYAFYTGVRKDEDGSEYQQQCLARSDDGFTFVKSENNPIVPNTLQPEGSKAADFRDPKVFRHGDGFRMMVASKGPTGGDYLFYDSTDLEHWTFAKKHIEGLGAMLECPDYFTLDGHTVTVASVMEMPPDGLRYPNSQPVVSMLDVETKEPDCVSIDYGLDFYAPQSVLTPDGRRVMIGWLRSWGNDFPPRHLGHNWNNMMTIPRELRIENDTLVQYPLRELETLRANERAFEGASFAAPHSRACELRLSVDVHEAKQLCLHIAKSEGEAFRIEYDVERQVLRTDRSISGYPMGKNGAKEEKPYREAILPLKNGKLELRVFLDTSCVEVFSADGTVAMSALFCPKGSADHLSVSSDNGSANFSLTIWDIIAKE
ncbi:MAG: glycoside hydrolase family 32 protein [Clostridia bacterium]|nr:glycoside hydrolase family 32 protein [Clostridia bacterium]